MRFTVTLTACFFVAALAVAQCDDPYDPGKPDCGNNKVESGEQCDQEAGAGFACADVGMGEGTVTCTDECRWDFTGCTAAPTCGNDVRDAGEACDGSDVGTLECTDLGFDAGALGCQANCFFDLFGCCRDGCDTYGETRCSGDVAETCTVQASGCLDWGDAVDCAALTPTQVCDATGNGFGCTAPPCTDACTLEGTTRCDATMIQTCEEGTEGCLEWTDTLDCGASQPPQGCDDSGAAAYCYVDCTDTCSAVGDLRCAYGDTVLQTCTRQASGCLAWSDTEDCTLLSASGFCNGGGATPVCQACQNDCTTAGDRDCVDDVLRECVQVVNGCLEWQVQADCAALGLYCDSCDGPPDCISGC